MGTMTALRDWLRQQPLWVRFQEVNREGWGRAWRRRSIQPRILDTPPLLTARQGLVEVRVLTWRRDWVNLIWALKSFYHFAGVDYPLFIHDGGLLHGQAERLMRHFPSAYFIGTDEADKRVEPLLTDRGLSRCLEYRRRNVSVRKLFDFYLLSRAESVVMIDSDIVFFRRPELLLMPPDRLGNNRYNKDSAYWYSLSLDELESSFGVRPPPLINSGLAVVRRTSIDFNAVERWLAHPKLFADTWVTEQTLHALCSTVHGVELLPDDYCVSTQPGLTAEMVCKHYPGFFRHLLYEEGMRHLIDTGFLRALEARGGSA
jgi:hypothetical protein